VFFFFFAFFYSLVVSTLAANDDDRGLIAFVAGTGKSVLLREIIKSLRKTHVKSPDAVAVTASTGTSSIPSLKHRF